MPSGFRVVFTGNIGSAQGLDVVLDAAEQLALYDDISWVIIGDGRERRRLQRAVSARGLGGRVLFLGRRPMARIPIYLALADAALLCLGPERLYSLTLPAKIQSYLACGVPLVAAVDGDPARVIVESGSGLVGPAGDALSLAHNVLRMHGSSAAERQAYSANGLRYFKENFRKDGIMAKIDANLRLAAGSPRMGRRIRGYEG
jgi:glycosyltransferase involved in cell wall biosynthesis